MNDDAVRQLLTERLPSPPPDMTEPPLAAIRRRVRRRAGTQISLAVAAVAGTAVWVVDGDTAVPAAGGSGVAGSTTATSVSPGMLYPTYLPPGYHEVEGGSETELRYLGR